MDIGKVACIACLIVPLMLVVAIGGFVLSIVEIVYGAKYLDDCPAEKLIPIYLIVMGVFGLVSSLLSGNTAREQRGKQMHEGENAVEPKSGGQKAAGGLGGLVNLFVFIWFICGHVFVFRTDPTFEEYGANHTENSNYCAKPVYDCARYTILVRWIITAVFVGLTVLICCGVCCCALCMKNNSADNSTGRV